MTATTRARGLTARGLLATLATAWLVVLLPTWAAADPGPEVQLDTTTVAVGGEVRVQGTGWKPGDLVDISLCAAPSRSGVLKCAEGGVSNVAVLWDGSFNETLVAERPAAPCPCTVVADSPAAPPVTVPIELQDHKVAKKVTAPEVVVDSASLEGGGSVGSWFGAGATPSLWLTLRNAGKATAQPVLELSWRNGDGDPVEVQAPQVPEIAPGRSVTVEVPVQLDGLAQGEHTVSGIVHVGDMETGISASTTVVPWGLYLLGLLALAVGSAHRARYVIKQHALEREDEATPEEELAEELINHYVGQRSADEVQVPRQRRGRTGSTARRAEPPRGGTTKVGSHRTPGSGLRIRR